MQLLYPRCHYSIQQHNSCRWLLPHTRRGLPFILANQYFNLIHNTQHQYLQLVLLNCHHHKQQTLPWISNFFRGYAGRNSLAGHIKVLCKSAVVPDHGIKLQEFYCWEKIGHNSIF